jgi:pimeloyl-ACP methyl ester carboxylesterase
MCGSAEYRRRKKTMTQSVIRLIAASCLALLSFQAYCASIYDTFPGTIHPDERYVIYSHGLIVEGKNPTPEHPRFGIYDFPAIKLALFREGDFNLIAHHRPANTNFSEYVSTLESWVRQLLAARVKPGRITLVGFSRGAQLTLYASSRLEAAGINTALMAVCPEGGFGGEQPLALGGHVLSIFETSDVVGTCEMLAKRSPNLLSFREVAISTGLGHGAFYRPIPEWLEPLKQWIAETNR